MKGYKTGGRIKGTPNRLTSSTRESLKKFIDDNRSEMETLFKALSPRDRWLIYEKLLSYVIPRYSNVNMNITQMSDEEIQLLINTLKTQRDGSNEDQQD